LLRGHWLGAEHRNRPSSGLFVAASKAEHGKKRCWARDIIVAMALLGTTAYTHDIR
jgi:hypothetical protein